MKAFLKLSAIFLFLSPNISFAHSFGRLYNLPVPFSLYLFGGAGAMLISFLFIGYFFGQKPQEGRSYRKDLSQYKFFNLLTHPRFKAFLKYLSFLLFILTVLSGLFGADNMYSNWNMTFFWIIFILGFTYFTAIFGNTYPMLNPWQTLTDWVVGKEVVALTPYPKRLSYYPAVFFYFLFIWLELVGHATPFKLSIALIVYTLITDLGVVLWGKEVWYKYCDFFGVFFRMVGKIAPIEYAQGRIYLRPFFSGILKDKPEDLSLLLFVVFMISSTAFDGFKETILYTSFYFRYIDNIFRPFLGTGTFAIFTTLCIAVSPFVFLLIYLFFIYLAKLIAKNSLAFSELALYFAFSLLPIALVYHLAHYYTLLFTEGPGIFRLISDPLGVGNNFFGTAGYYQSFLLPVNIIWHSQVALILLGHIAGVYLTHVVLLEIFPSGKKLIWSQVPTLLLMVTFTCIGLWILAQPITGGAL